MFKRQWPRVKFMLQNNLISILIVKILLQLFLRNNVVPTQFVLYGPICYGALKSAL